jgi:hypothetical protein
MVIGKGSPYGEPGTVPAGGLVVSADAQARRAVEEARRRNGPFPVIGLQGGDLCRTLGGPGSLGMTFPVDLGEVLVDGRLHYFVAHLVARTPTWSYAFVAMNAQWLGRWNAGPRAHPNDGLLDTYEARLGWQDRLEARRRLHHGTHVPHPDIRQRRAAAIQVEHPKPLPVILDGERVGVGRNLSIRVEADALRVVI